jgi:hypothetical protein
MKVVQSSNTVHELVVLIDDYLFKTSTRLKQSGGNIEQVLRTYCMKSSIDAQGLFL